MLKKIREGEKGFTLVELLAVIVILGIIVAIAIPAIGSVIDNAQSDADEATETMIIDAARLYATRAENDYPVSIEELLDGDYLEARQGTEFPEKGWVQETEDEDGNTILEFTETDPTEGN